MLKVMLIGKQRSGKDTAAAFLKDLYDFKNIALAEEVKRLANVHFGVTTKDRKLLINLANAVREVDKQYFIDIAEDKVEHAIANGHRLVCITDVRLANEYDYFIKRGFIPIKIIADKAKRIARGADREFLDHPSETACDNMPALYTIPNNATLDCLRRRIYTIMYEIGGTSFFQLQLELKALKREWKNNVR